MKIIGIIPCRYASKRFPGKPLAHILGQPMLWHVWSRCKQSKLLQKVFIATGDDEIWLEAIRLQIPVMLTKGAHTTGTDRICEVAQTLQLEDDDIVVNIQGDEPLIDPGLIDKIIWPLLSGLSNVSTPIYRGCDIGTVKAYLRDIYAIHFDRNNYTTKAWQHVGVYAFRMSALKKFADHGPSELEKIDKLEQMRFIAMNIPIRAVQVDYKGWSVDRQEDIYKVEEILKGENIDERV